MADEDTPPPVESPGVPIEAIADPELLALVEKRFRPELVRTSHLVSYAGELPHHLDPAAWRTGFLAVHEGGTPPDIRDVLREATPQAQLRDLFRPVYSDAPVPLDRIELPLDPGGRAAFAELRAALRREPLPFVVRSLELVDEEQARRRAFLAAPWQPFLRDDEPRREVHVAIEPSLTA